MCKRILPVLLAVSGALYVSPVMAQSHEKIVGNIRVQALSETLIRIEQRGPKGFEERVTFTVVERHWPGAALQIHEENGQTALTTSKVRIEIPEGAESLAGIRVQGLDGRAVHEFDGLPGRDYLPAPSDRGRFWIMADSPRLIPPEWGATPAPEDLNDAASGWDTGSNAQDVYVFLLEDGRYGKFREEFLKLTGPVPMPPLYTFGLWDSRYHPYSEESALETIDTYRSKDIPLDVFVVDTDWRVGASHGYGVNESLFPDMRRFIRRAHEKNVKLMYNDHPEPQAATALDPMEMKYRWDGLSSLFDMGIDVWWFDRNWHTGLLEPMPGIRKEVWGMRVYHDITRANHPDRRPMIMSNVDGIDNGIWNYASHPAAHRFPIWWTGDQLSRWDYLERGVANGVNSGIDRLMPYVNEDLGGHTGGNPEPEQYIRWVQFGAFSPVMRLHCTAGLTRYPWEYGDDAERIASDYIRLRYRLLPMIYSAAREAYEDGTPLMRRCDLEWPGEPEARRDSQYLFGEDLLVAPVALAKTRDVLPSEDLFHTVDGQSGLTGEYFNNMALEGDPVLVRRDASINFLWEGGSPHSAVRPDSFSVRWTGSIRLPEDGVSRFNAVSDDGVRVWIGDRLVVNDWRDQAPTDHLLMDQLKPGETYPVKIEYYEHGGGAQFQLLQNVDVEQVYDVWMPPGSWQDVWTGEVLQGPQIVKVTPVLNQCPLYVRNGGLVVSLPQMQHSSERPWQKVVIDAFVPVNDMKTTRTLYEDDGISPEYQQEAYCKTAVIQTRTGDRVVLAIDAVKGHYDGALTERDWVIRFNLPENTKAGNIKINGKKPDEKSISHLLIRNDGTASMPFMGQGSPACAAKGSVLEISMQRQHTDKAFTVSFEVK